ATECRLDGPSGAVSGWATCASPKSFDISGRSDGDYTFGARASDAAGNTGASATDTYTLDTAGPTVTITSSPTSPGNDLHPTWSFTTDPGATTECRLGNGSSTLSDYAPCSD